jgi:hypothetical protein
MSEFAVVTVATCNYLHYAAALARSVREQHPEAPLHVCLVDRPWPGVALPAEEGVRYFHADELAIPAWPRFTFQYLPFPLSAAVKSFAVGKVLDEAEPDKLIFLDSDTHLYHPLTEVVRSLDACDIIITPHLCSPRASESRHQDELWIKASGVYNSGFLGLRRGANARALVRWWQDKLYKMCIDARFAHLFVDQSWLDLVPGLFAGVRVERGLGYNVGYWNVGQRPISLGPGGRFDAAGEPLVFFHYSGYDMGRPDCLSKWIAHVDPGFDQSAQPGLAPLLRAYSERLRACGWETYSRVPYGYAALDDGTPIQPVWREMIRVDYPPLADVADPYDTAATPNLVRRFEEAAQEFTATPDGHQARLQQLESLYRSLDSSPLLGPLLRRYKVFRDSRALQ